MESVLLRLDVSIILRLRLPPRNPEFDEECPLVSASQTIGTGSGQKINPRNAAIVAIAAGFSLILTKLVEASCVASGFRRIHRGYLTAKGIACLCGLLRGLNAADAAPALASLGFDLAHLLNRVMGAAVVAEFGLGSHESDCQP
jgi:hypothetical protein